VLPHHYRSSYTTDNHEI